MATEFQKSVWQAIGLIPKGKVTTYGEIAKYLNTKAVQAVGTAVGKNPYAPKVPCHRVVKSSGEVGEYSAPGGVESKISLLKKEGVKIVNNRVKNFKNKLYTYENNTKQL